MKLKLSFLFERSFDKEYITYMTFALHKSIIQKFHEKKLFPYLEMVAQARAVVVNQIISYIENVNKKLPSKIVKISFKGIEREIIWKLKESEVELLDVLRFINKKLEELENIGLDYLKISYPSIVVKYSGIVFFSSAKLVVVPFYENKLAYVFLCRDTGFYKYYYSLSEPVRVVSTKFISKIKFDDFKENALSKIRNNLYESFFPLDTVYVDYNSELKLAFGSTILPIAFVKIGKLFESNR